MFKWIAAIGLGISFGVLSALAAFFSPGMVPSEGLGPPVNLFWSAIYGLGWEVCAIFADVRTPNSQLIGGKIWPFLMFILVSVGFSWAWVAWKFNRRRILLFAIASFFVLVPVRWVANGPLRYLPNYTATLAGVY